MEYLFYYIPPAANKTLGECLQGKINFGDSTTFFFFSLKTFSYNIFNDNAQEQLI